MPPAKKKAGAPAASSSSAKKPSSTPPARPLTPRARLLLLIAFPLALAGFAVGGAGMVVLAAPEGAPAWLSPDSAFASAWRSVLAKNMFVQPFLFNFGAIASLGCAMRLAEGRRAEAAAVAASKRR
jgi:hypothetical protein